MILKLFGSEVEGLPNIAQGLGDCLYLAGKVLGGGICGAMCRGCGG